MTDVRPFSFVVELLVTRGRCRMRLVHSEWHCGRRIPNEAAPTPPPRYHRRKQTSTYYEVGLDAQKLSVHNHRHGQKTTTAFDSAKSKAVWQPMRAASASPVSLGMSLYVNHPHEKEKSMGLCPITEYRSAWVADPATGLFHDATRSACSDCFVGEPELLALTPSAGSTDPTHGFMPCARCFGPAGHSSRAGGSE